jgi:L-alanine-DL-glutamate epimerase-like enolase superfamily enzyme
MNALPPFRLHARTERWPLKTPFRITGHTWEALEVVVVELEAEGVSGRGEAAGVYYRKETAASILREIEGVRRVIESGDLCGGDLSCASLQALLPAGGARNALDCALWDWRAKRSGQPVWRLAGLEEPHPLLTTFTCGADTPEVMAATARGYVGARAIKLKLTGHESDAARVNAVRAALPQVWLGVDANQGFTPDSLKALLPTLIDAHVSLIEQPFPVGREGWLDGLGCPIPLAADETVQHLRDVAALVGRFQVMNIKLDKCGGLTEALEMARAAQELGLELMVGNMLGTSLAMAPAYLLGQLCRVVDLDGPVFLTSDRTQHVEYESGSIRCPANVWGSP